MPDDYYALLGVDPDASEEAILRAYRERVAEHHPDVSDADDAGETFRRLNRAKDVLTDEDRRREYDSLGHDRYLERARDGEHDPGDSGARPGGATEGSGGLDSRYVGSPSSGTPSWVPWPIRRGSITGGEFFSARGGLDLRSFLRSSGPRAGRQAGPTREHQTTDQAVECPKCHGRGRFVHELDTALGHRRRIEPCERCGGAGTIDR